MRILALMKYGRRSASTRQRLLQFQPYLERNGIEIEVSPLLSNDYVARLAAGKRPDPFSIAVSYLYRLARLLGGHRYDAIWVHYEAFPYLPGFAERVISLTGKPVICDYDDAIFHMYDRHSSRLLRHLLGKKLVPLLQNAALCICGNSYLKTYAERYCANSAIIPTVVDTRVYRPKANAESNGALCVGWIGSPSTWRYVEPLLPDILPVIERHGGILRVVGAGPAAAGIAGVEAVDWEEEGEVELVQSMDIGIMPLPDQEWARGKCGYKLIQYMGCGLPVVASPVGVNKEIVEDGVNGFLASSADEWKRALDQLLSDAACRARMGKEGRRKVEAQYSLARHEPRLLNMLLSVASGTQPAASAPTWSA